MVDFKGKKTAAAHLDVILSPSIFDLVKPVSDSGRGLIMVNILILFAIRGVMTIVFFLFCWSKSAGNIIDLHTDNRQPAY